MPVNANSGALASWFGAEQAGALQGSRPELAQLKLAWGTAPIASGEQVRWDGRRGSDRAV